MRSSLVYMEEGDSGHAGTTVQGARRQPPCGGRNFERLIKPPKSRPESGEITLILRFSEIFRFGALISFQGRILYLIELVSGCSAIDHGLMATLAVVPSYTCPI